MNIQAVALRAFRSFTQDQVFNFAQKPGFYFLGGDNQVDESLGANAVGKSSIFEGIVWCLYASTSRGLYAPALKSTDSEEVMSVVLDFELDGAFYSLTRTHKPNTLTLQKGEDGTPRTVTQDEVQDLIRIPKAAFLHSSFIGQFSVYFLALKGAERMNLISSVLDLQVWEHAAKKATADAREIHSKVENQTLLAIRGEESFSSCKAEVRQAEQDVNAAQERFDDAEYNRKADLEDLNEQVAARVKTLEGLTPDEKAQADRCAVLDGKLAIAAGRVHKASKALTEGKASLKYDKKLRLDALNALNAAQSLEQCPTCGSQHGLEEMLENCTLALDAAEHRHKLSTEGLEDAQAKHDACTAAHTTLAQKVHKQQNKLTRLRTAWNECEEERRSLARRAEAIESASAGDGDLERARAALTRRNKQLKKAQAVAKSSKLNLQESTQSWEEHRAWVERFKDIRTWMLSQAICELEVRSNNCIRDLGLEDWEITFDVEKEGTAKKGCHVTVKDPTGESRQWEAWSGGEAQRLAIAVEVAIAEMVRSRYGVTSTFEIWDEPTAHLSASGVQDLLEFLKIRARQQSLEVWMIDHREPDSGDFDDSATVVKTDKGSRIVR